MPSAGDDDFCRTKKTLEKKAQFGVQISTDNRDVAAFADIILFVAVKPQFYAEVLEEIRIFLQRSRFWYPSRRERHWYGLMKCSDEI